MVLLPSPASRGRWPPTRRNTGWGSATSNFAPTAASASASLNPATLRKRFKTSRTRSRPPVSPRYCCTRAALQRKPHPACATSKTVSERLRPAWWPHRNATKHPRRHIGSASRACRTAAQTRRLKVQPAAAHVVPASNCNPPLWRVMKLSSREASMRCRLRVASATVEYRLQIHVQRCMAERRQIDQRGSRGPTATPAPDSLPWWSRHCRLWHL